MKAGAPAPAPQPVTSPHASQRPRGSASHMPSPAPVADGASAIGAVRTEIAALGYDPTLYSDPDIAAFLRQVEMSAKTDISAIAPPTSPSTALSSASPPPVQLPPSGDPAKHEPAPPPPVLKTELPPSCDIAQHEPSPTPTDIPATVIAPPPTASPAPEDETRDDTSYTNDDDADNDVTPSILNTWNHFQQQHGGKGWSKNELATKYEQRCLPPTSSSGPEEFERGRQEGRAQLQATIKTFEDEKKQMDEKMTHMIRTAIMWKTRAQDIARTYGAPQSSRI